MRFTSQEEGKIKEVTDEDEKKDKKKKTARTPPPPTADRRLRSPPPALQLGNEKPCEVLRLRRLLFKLPRRGLRR